MKRASQGYVNILGEGVTYKITQIVDIDMPHDLCVFKASGASAPPLMLAIGTKPAVGDDVYVGGNPRGLESTFSKGIISAIRRGGLIQIDAAISPGSSGGPVVNTKAEVVGIAASSLVEGQNLNFAIDANYLRALPHEWKAPVVTAGALALRDREIDEVKGAVRSVISKTVTYDYDQVNDRYVEGQVLFTETQSYDYEGNLIEGSFYDKNGEFRSRTRFEYNERGFRVRSSHSSKNQPEKSVAISENDSINHKIDQFNSYNYDHSSVSEAEATSVETGKKRLLRTVRTFDHNGWMTEETKYFDGRKDLTDRYRYDVDEHGNWVRRYDTTYNPSFPELGFTPDNVVYREIKYYDGR